MSRILFSLTLFTMVVTLLSGCLVVDRHHNHNIPPGQMKKMMK